MDLPTIEGKVRAAMKMTSVQGITGFPCRNYSDFLIQHKAGNIRVLTKYDSDCIQRPRQYR